MTVESQIGTIDRMTTQIAVRLPDHLVEFLDERVAAGEPSRAKVVIKALMKYERQLSAERDGEIYRTTPDDPEMIALAQWNAQQPKPWLD
jgi:Arc/MetJ-type ribon-helix-helix transcriptional regulator